MQTFPLKMRPFLRLIDPAVRNTAISYGSLFARIIPAVELGWAKFPFSPTFSLNGSKKQNPTPKYVIICSQFNIDFS